MAKFVLVPGAWVGAWVWKEVAGILWSQGHEVYPVTLTGLADRSHLANADVDLDMHIRDVQNVINFNELSEVVLVGHSYAGIVIRGVADRIASLISHTIYVDSAPFDNGTANIDFYPEEVTAAMRRGVDEHGDGWRLPHPTAATIGNLANIDGLSEEDLQRFERLATDQPFLTYTQPLRLTGTSDDWYKRTAILCNDGKIIRQKMEDGEIPNSFTGEWQFHELNTGHWPMLSQPKELATLLDQLAS